MARRRSAVATAESNGDPTRSFNYTLLPSNMLGSAELFKTPEARIDEGGIGGTVSGSVLSAVAIRTTLREVLTDDAFPQMIATANRWADGAEEVFTRRSVGWSVTRLGARAEYHFTPEAPRSGGEAAAAVHHEMER